MTESTSITALANAGETAAMPGYGDAEYWFALIDEKEAAEFLDLTDRTLQKYRQSGGGPKFCRLSARCIKYRRHDLRLWAEAALRSSTSDTGEANAA
jgi:hypothetical protein